MLSFEFIIMFGINTIHYLPSASVTARIFVGCPWDQRDLYFTWSDPCARIDEMESTNQRAARVKIITAALDEEKSLTSLRIERSVRWSKIKRFLFLLIRAICVLYFVSSFLLVNNSVFNILTFWMGQILNVINRADTIWKIIFQYVTRY